MRQLTVEDLQARQRLYDAAIETCEVLRGLGQQELADRLSVNVGFVLGQTAKLKPRFVRMKPLKNLVRQKLIKISHMSDDGEFMRFKVVGCEGVEYGRWVSGDEPLLVVDCSTEHVNMVNAHPQLFEELPAPTAEGAQ